MARRACRMSSVTGPVWLVRHAMPEVCPEVPPHRWELGPDGREAARALAAVLPAGAAVVTSAERKAVLTGDEIVAVRGGSARVDARLGEVGPPPGWTPDHPAPARRWVEGRGPETWERPAAVAARMDAAVVTAAAGAAGRPVVVVGHGMALTCWLHRRGLLPDPGAFWSDLRFPDAVRVDTDTDRAVPHRPV